MNIKQLKNIITVIIIKKQRQHKPDKSLLLFYVLIQYKQAYLRLSDCRTKISQHISKLLNSFVLKCKT